jgi:hypothetical protein
MDSTSRDNEPHIGHRLSRPKRLPELEGVEGIKPSYIKKLIEKFLQYTPHELIVMSQDPRSTLLEQMIGSIIQKAIMKGDPVAMEYILDRTVGRVPAVTTVETGYWDKELEQVPRENILKLLRNE